MGASEAASQIWMLPFRCPVTWCLPSVATESQTRGGREQHPLDRKVASVGYTVASLSVAAEPAPTRQDPSGTHTSMLLPGGELIFMHSVAQERRSFTRRARSLDHGVAQALINEATRRMQHDEQANDVREAVLVERVERRRLPPGGWWQWRGTTPSRPCRSKRVAAQRGAEWVLVSQ